MADKQTCESGLKRNVIDKETFEREVGLCSQLSEKKNGKCGWGVCKDCGVIPLLYKLHDGKLVEEDQEIEDLKKKYLI